MEEIAISKFKGTWLAVSERVNNTGEPILVTRFGKPVATIMPPGIAQHVTRSGQESDQQRPRRYSRLHQR